MIIRILLLLLIALPAWAVPERVNLCTGATCNNANVTEFGRDVRMSVSVDDDFGCPATATYSIQGKNQIVEDGVTYTGVNYFVLAVISTASEGMAVLDPSIYLPIVRVVPSDATGCSSLEVNLWIERQ